MGKNSKISRVGLLGGTFDPIHNGHLAVARAARRAFRLDRIYFIPCGVPPHKRRAGRTAFLHRYVMVVLACTRLSRTNRGAPVFVPSLLEAGPDLRGRRRIYSIHTVRRVQQELGRQTKFFFLMGADSFLYVRTWKNLRQLVRLCNFIVVTRPGFDLRRGLQALPRGLNRDAIYFLRGVSEPVSSSEIRRQVRRGGSRRWLRTRVPEEVAGYIELEGLYRRKP